MIGRILYGACILILLCNNISNCLSVDCANDGNALQVFPRTQNDSINPVDVFEQIWQVLNNNYPYFDQRGIDWNALHKLYASKIASGTSDEELFNILCCMLEHFNDAHINLETGEKKFCSAIKVNAKMEDFSWNLVRDKYLNKSFRSSPDSLVYYGWLTDDFAYMRVRRFPTKEVLEKYIDNIIGELSKAKGLVIDVRGNPGGNGFGVAALGSRFADRKRLYLKNINRVGQTKAYTSCTYHYIEPKGPVQYRGTVILLQNVYSESGADAFALAMRVLPNVTSIGEPTAGCFATYYPEKLINGWTLTMPWSYVVDQNDFCWEGIGIPPDLRKINTKEGIAAGNDKVLELAVDVLKVGGHYGKEYGGSLNDLRISLVDQFVETAGKKDIKSAVAQFEEAQKKNPDGVYFAIQELHLTVRKLSAAEKSEEAMALLELGLKAFPEDINTMYFLAKNYENFKKQPDKSRPLYEKISMHKPNFPWENNMVNEAKNFLDKKEQN